MPDSYRPTLYDFIAHEALEFYTSGEQAAAKPEDAFELSAGQPHPRLGRRSSSAWQPAAGARHRLARAQGHPALPGPAALPQNDAAPALAFADADLERLTWGWNTAFGEDKNARYKAALEAFIRTYADFDISALAMEREARRAPAGRRPGRRAQAGAARRAKSFPQSPGGKLCRNLVTEIEAKSAEHHHRAGLELLPGSRQASRLPAEDKPDACPTLTVRYRNVEAVYFRAIPV